MQINLTTPALLFPAISLLMLAYTNRFVTLANVVRKLHADYKSDPDPLHLRQITNLRKRIYMIKRMQELGVASFLVCVVCMGFVYYELPTLSHISFVLSLGLFSCSLLFSMAEISISTQALDIRLSDMEKRKGTPAKD